MVYTVQLKKDLEYARHTVLQGIAVSMMFPAATQSAAWKPENFLGMNLNDLYGFLTSAFSGGAKLKLENGARPMEY